MPPRPPRPVPALDPVLDFMRLLWTIEHGLQRTSKLMHSRLGVTGPQRLVLLIVSRAPGISAGDLAHVVRLHPSTITGVLQRLVRKGLLVREPDPADTRRVRLQIRAQAQSLVGRADGTVEDAVARALRRVPAAQLQHARAVLSTLAVALESGRESTDKTGAPRRARRVRLRHGPNRSSRGRQRPAR